MGTKKSVESGRRKSLKKKVLTVIFLPVALVAGILTLVGALGALATGVLVAEGARGEARAEAESAAHSAREELAESALPADLDAEDEARRLQDGAGGERERLLVALPPRPWRCRRGPSGSCSPRPSAGAGRPGSRRSR